MDRLRFQSAGFRIELDSNLRDFDTAIAHAKVHFRRPQQAAHREDRQAGARAQSKCVAGVAISFVRSRSLQPCNLALTGIGQPAEQ